MKLSTAALLCVVGRSYASVCIANQPYLSPPHEPSTNVHEREGSFAALERGRARRKQRDVDAVRSYGGWSASRLASVSSGKQQERTNNGGMPAAGSATSPVRVARVTASSEVAKGAAGGSSDGGGDDDKRIDAPKGAAGTPEGHEVVCKDGVCEMKPKLPATVPVLHVASPGNASEPERPAASSSIVPPVLSEAATPKGVMEQQQQATGAELSPETGEINQEALKELIKMGWDETEAADALRIAGNDVVAAAEALAEAEETDLERFKEELEKMAAKGWDQDAALVALRRTGGDVEKAAAALQEEDRAVNEQFETAVNDMVSSGWDEDVARQALFAQWQKDIEKSGNSRKGQKQLEKSAAKVRGRKSSGGGGGGGRAKQEPPPQVPKESVVFEVTEANLQKVVVESPVPVLLDVYADWCGPCKQLGPMLEQAAMRSGGMFRLAKLNSDTQTALAQTLGVEALPAVFALRDGTIVDNFVGIPPGEQLQAFLIRLLMNTPRNEEVLQERQLPASTLGKLGRKLAHVAGLAALGPAKREKLGSKVDALLQEMVPAAEAAAAAASEGSTKEPSPAKEGNGAVEQKSAAELEADAAAAAVAAAKGAVRLVVTCLSRCYANMHDPKFKKISTVSAAYKTKLEPLPPSLAILSAAGFRLPAKTDTSASTNSTAAASNNTSSETNASTDISSAHKEGSTNTSSAAAAAAAAHVTPSSTSESATQISGSGTQKSSAAPQHDADAPALTLLHRNAAVLAVVQERCEKWLRSTKDRPTAKGLERLRSAQAAEAAAAAAAARSAEEERKREEEREAAAAAAALRAAAKLAVELPPLEDGTSGGSVIVELPSASPLSEAFAELRRAAPQLGSDAPIVLRCVFPSKRHFAEGAPESQKTLSELGLVPAARLTVARGKPFGESSAEVAGSAEEGSAEAREERAARREALRAKMRAAEEKRAAERKTRSGSLFGLEDGIVKAKKGKRNEYFGGDSTVTIAAADSEEEEETAVAEPEKNDLSNKTPKKNTFAGKGLAETSEDAEDDARDVGLDAEKDVSQEAEGGEVLGESESGEYSYYDSDEGSSQEGE